MVGGSCLLTRNPCLLLHYTDAVSLLCVGLRLFLLRFGLQYLVRVFRLPLHVTPSLLHVARTGQDTGPSESCSYFPCGEYAQWDRILVLSPSELGRSPSSHDPPPLDTLLTPQPLAHGGGGPRARGGQARRDQAPG